MKISQRFKAAIQTFNKSENSSAGRDLAQDFFRRGNRKPLIEDWSKVVMSDKELYSGYPYAAINKRANKVAYLAIDGIKTDATELIMKEARAKDEELYHPYLEVIDKSRSFSNFKFWHDISVFLDLEGVYYLMAVRTVAGEGTSKRIGNIQYFKMLNPYNIRRIRDKETLEIGGYVEARDGMVRTIPPEMIIEIRDLNPFSEDDPYSMTDAAKSSQFTLKQAGDYTRHSLKNNMAAPGIISTDVLLEPEQFANFVSRVTNQEKGLPLFGNGAGAITWDSMQIDMDKAALDKINEINRTELFAVSGVGKTNMAIEESGTTRETAKVQKDILVEDQIMPRLQSIIDAFNQDYKNNYEAEYEKTEYEMSVDNPLATDREAELKDIEIRDESYKLYDKLVGQGYDRELAAKYAEGEIDLDELGEPTNKPRPNPVVEAAMLKAGETQIENNDNSYGFDYEGFDSIENRKSGGKRRGGKGGSPSGGGNPNRDSRTGKFAKGSKKSNWKPSGTSKEANDFSKNSKYKATLLHGTSNTSAVAIKKDGFNPTSSKTGRQLGDGTYFIGDPKAAAWYAEKASGNSSGQVLKAKINVDKPYVSDYSQKMNIGGYEHSGMSIDIAKHGVETGRWKNLEGVNKASSKVYDEVKADWGNKILKTHDAIIDDQWGDVLVVVRDKKSIMVFED